VGTYDLGTSILDIPPQTTLSGRSQLGTRIHVRQHGCWNRAARVEHGSARLHRARDGTPAGASSNVTAVTAADILAPNATPVVNVRIERVTGIASAATGATGGRNGFYVCASNSRISDVTGYADGAQIQRRVPRRLPAASGSVMENVVV
jgi:hypothetical protein